MAKWNIINLSELENYKDFSSEYYRKEYIQKSDIIRKIGVIRAGTAAYITDGEHGSPRWSQTSGIKYITAEYIKENYIEQGEYKQITEEQDKKNARARLQKNDVLIYSVGAYAGLAALAEPHLFPANIPRSVAILRLIQNDLIIPEYVSVFLNTKYGKFQTYRLRAGNSQPVLALDKIRQLEIPVIENKKQEEIKELYQNAYRSRIKSREYFEQAKSLLYKELKLNELEIKPKRWFLAKYSSVVEAQRIDSNHFREEYSLLFDFLLSRFECKEIRQIVNLNRRGLQPKYVEDGEIMVVNSKHLSFTHINYDETERTSKEEFQKQQVAHIINGDVLIYTTGAYIGLTNCFNKDDEALASNHVNILRLSDKNIDPNYLALVLNTIIGVLQTQKYSRGSAQLELYPADIEKFLIPIIDKTKMKDIGDLVRKSLEYQIKSKEKLQEAKINLEEEIDNYAYKSIAQQNRA